jgi:hypothetical protein
MDGATEHRVVYAERVGDDVVIEFDDGECALYSADLLRSMLAQATRVGSSLDGDSEAD